MARSATAQHSPGNDAAIHQRGWARRAGMRAQRTQQTKERSMQVGMMMVFASYGWENCPDARVWDEEIRLARLAADLGFDCLWSAEHHFNDYSFVPDNLQLLTYLTALCPGVDLGTAAVIVPWHDPLRVAEQAAVLDMLSKGRLRLGLGRGLARREFAAFRLSMDESRKRFDEAAPMIVNALNTGFIEGDGNFYHYEFLGEHFKTVKGYDAYQQKAEIARKGGLEGAVAGFMQAASWGTPDKILRGLEERRKIVGDFELNVAFRFGGMPYDVAERGLKLFAKEVLPVLQAQAPAAARPAAE